MKAARQKASRNNLPAPLSTFIGREREIEELKQLLLAQRLVTITGPGGSGKTRLSLQVAREMSAEFEHGIWFVELASLSDPALLSQSVAITLNIREQPGRSWIHAVVGYLSSLETLLILDNCEHLIASCAEFVEHLLQRCPGLKVLVTSRETLGITGESAWVVPPLTVPDPQAWTRPTSERETVHYYAVFESVRLFVERAKMIDHPFRLTAENGPWIAQICRRLDGMPLAIELAAARVRTLSVQQIAHRLNERFQLLTAGSRTAPARQQTLSSTLDWSYALLPEQEQKILMRLSVMVGGATLEAAEAICAGGDVEPIDVLDVLSALVNKSLVTTDKPEPGEARFLPRYRLLETIRQYALGKLAEAGELEGCRDRHLDYFVQWAESAEKNLGGPEQLLWLEAYESEHDNLRTALEWCLAGETRGQTGLQLALACGRFWRLRGYLSEGRAHLLAALASLRASQRTPQYARGLFWAAALSYLQSDYPETRRLGEQSLALWRELEPHNKAGLADILDLLGELATEEGDYESALARLREALELFREMQDRRGIADMLMQLGWASMRMGNYAEVAAHMEEALGLFRELANTSLVAFALAGLGELAIRQGEYDRATELLEESLFLRRQHGHKWGIGASLGSLGWVALRQHDFPKMRTLLHESLLVRKEIDDRGGIAWCLEKLAEAKYQQSELEESARIFGHAESLRVPLGSVIDPADRPGYDQIISDLRSSLGEERFRAACAEGAGMPLEHIIDAALSTSRAVSGYNGVSAGPERAGGLTPREYEVVTLIAQGKTNREIAEVMTVRAKTVETYVTRILGKLGLDSRVQVALWAVEKGLK